MSVASQFFPSSGGAGGSATEIPVEILGMGGGGGQGGCCPPVSSSGGYGGSGGLFHATNYSVEPGITVPITIGSGGGFASCPYGAGGQGGTTSFNYPKLPISVVGGGGGAYGYSGCSACPGGSGGGGMSNIPTSYSWTTAGGAGCYYSKLNETIVCSSLVYSPGFCGKAQSVMVLQKSVAESENTPWGLKAGYPGLPGYKATPYAYSPGVGGSTGGNTERIIYCYISPCGCSTCSCAAIVCSSKYQSSISGNSLCYGSPTTFGMYGCSGGLIIKWATVHGAAPSYPGATDISPQTPGYYTYCFTSSGSITLP